MAEGSTFKSWAVWEKKLFPGQICMAGPCGQKKGIKKPRLDAVIGVRKYPTVWAISSAILNPTPGDIIRQTGKDFPGQCRTGQGRTPGKS